MKLNVNVTYNSGAINLFVNTVNGLVDMMVSELINITLTTVYMLLITACIFMGIVFIITLLYAVVVLIYRSTGKLEKLYRILEKIERNF